MDVGCHCIARSSYPLKGHEYSAGQKFSPFMPFLTTPLTCITEMCLHWEKTSRHQTPWNIETDDTSTPLNTRFYKLPFSLAFTCLQAKVAGPVTRIILNVTRATEVKRGVHKSKNITGGEE